MYGERWITGFEDILDRYGRDEKLTIEEEKIIKEASPKELDKIKVDMALARRYGMPFEFLEFMSDLFINRTLQNGIPYDINKYQPTKLLRPIIEETSWYKTAYNTSLTFKPTIQSSIMSLMGYAIPSWEKFLEIALLVLAFAYCKEPRNEDAILFVTALLLSMDVADSEKAPSDPLDAIPTNAVKTRLLKEVESVQLAIKEVNKILENKNLSHLTTESKSLIQKKALSIAYAMLRLPENKRKAFLFYFESDMKVFSKLPEKIFILFLENRLSKFGLRTPHIGSEGLKVWRRENLDTVDIIGGANSDLEGSMEFIANAPRPDEDVKYGIHYIIAEVLYTDPSKLLGAISQLGIENEFRAFLSNAKSFEQKIVSYCKEEVFRNYASYQLTRILESTSKESTYNTVFSRLEYGFRLCEGILEDMRVHVPDTEVNELFSELSPSGRQDPRMPFTEYAKGDPQQLVILDFIQRFPDHFHIYYKVVDILWNLPFLFHSLRTSRWYPQRSDYIGAKEPHVPKFGPALLIAFLAYLSFDNDEMLAILRSIKDRWPNDRIEDIVPALEILPYCAEGVKTALALLTDMDISYEVASTLSKCIVSQQRLLHDAINDFNVERERMNAAMKEQYKLYEDSTLDFHKRGIKNAKIAVIESEIWRLLKELANSMMFDRRIPYMGQEFPIQSFKKILPAAKANLENFLKRTPFNKALEGVMEENIRDILRRKEFLPIKKELESYLDTIFR